MLKTMLAGVAALALLGGCAQSGTAPVVTLSGAQAEAAAILTALEAGASIYTGASTTTPAEAQAVENVLNDAQAAVSSFEAAQANENAAQTAETVSQDIAAVLAVMPIDPVTKTAIDAGMAVIDALVAGLAAAPATSAAPTLSVKLGAPVPPPVPIPAPKVLPPRA
ncbi:MAG TPA: hypothetical protein VMF62_17400 [Acetobacteraceae bacterium]|jgi:DNA-binding NarL/FixJ family response regulator|nr:hypothetical protein [Acetobacteraceae bacterium]